MENRRGSKEGLDLTEREVSNLITDALDLACCSRQAKSKAYAIKYKLLTSRSREGRSTWSQFSLNWDKTRGLVRRRGEHGTEIGIGRIQRAQCESFRKRSTRKKIMFVPSRAWSVSGCRLRNETRHRLGGFSIKTVPVYRGTIHWHHFKLCKCQS